MHLISVRFHRAFPLIAFVMTLVAIFAVLWTGISMLPELTGSLIHHGVRGGTDIVTIEFNNSEIHELIDQGTLAIVLTPSTNTDDATDFPEAVPMGLVVHGTAWVGYRHTSQNATVEKAAAERAASGQPTTYPELFSGQFFASAEARTNTNFVEQFENVGITFAVPGAVTLERNARYAVSPLDAAIELSLQPGIAWCGDDKMSDADRCDDTNDADGDGCSSACVIEPGFSCTGVLCTKTHPACGNGIMNDPEECDVGEVPASGCSNVCQVKPGFTCNNSPSICNQDLLSLAGWYRTSGSLGEIADPPIAGSRYDHVENPVVTKIDDHRALAVWSQGLFHFNEPTVTRRAILASVYDGMSWSAPQVIDPMSDIGPIGPEYCGTCTAPVVTSDTRGNVHIFWTGVTGLVPDEEVDQGGFGWYVVTFDGTNFSQKKLMSVFPHFLGGDLTVRFNEHGEGVAAWYGKENLYSDVFTIFATHYSPSTGWSPAETVTSSKTGGRPGLGIDSVGTVTLLYHDLVYVTERYELPIYRTDIFSRTFAGTTWSSPVPVVRELETWEGYSHSYPSGMTYTRSANQFAFEMRPDGTALLAYGLTIPSQKNDMGKLPMERLYTKEFKNGAWTPSTNQEPDSESYIGINPLIDVDPSSDGGVVLWFQYFGNSNVMFSSKLLRNGVWSQPSYPDFSGKILPLFVRWSPERGRYLVGMTKGVYQNAIHYRSIALLDLIPESGIFTQPYSLVVPRSYDARSGSVAELADHFAFVWIQSEDRHFVDDPRYSIYQHILKQAVFAK